MGCEKIINKRYKHGLGIFDSNEFQIGDIDKVFGVMSYQGNFRNSCSGSNPNIVIVLNRTPNFL